MSRNIVIIATLDTKGEEASYLRELILKRGHKPVLIDVGFGHPARLMADITADEVARAGRSEIEELRASKDRRQIIEAMTNGAIVKLNDLNKAGAVSGIIAIGGITSTVLASGIMKEMPVGIPKLILSTAASIPGSHRFFGPTGITMMHSLVDIGGLNSLLKVQLGRAARAICSMVEEEGPSPNSAQQKPMVAMTAYGLTENCARYVYEALGGKYDLVRFHAIGLPEIAMEKLIEEGLFTGVIDLVPSSITNALYGGVRTSWPKRLEIAGEQGIPQIVAPGGINTFAQTGFTADALPPELKTHRHYFMDPQRVTIFLSTEELRNIASIYAQKLNKAVGPTKFLIPMRGWTGMEREQADLYDPEGSRAFVNKLRKELKAEIELREIDANIEDQTFAEAVVESFEEVMKQGGVGIQ
jgi:uncharacterized protein (UPF0261 family)